MSQLSASGGQSIGVSASASVLPIQERNLGLISFRMDWLDLLAGQGTLKSLLQHHNYTYLEEHVRLDAINLKLKLRSVTQSCSTLCDPMDCSTPGLPAHLQLLELLKLMFIYLVMPSNLLILCHSLLFLFSIFPSIRVFSNESVLHIRWPKFCSFSFSISASNEYLGLISFRIDWFDLLAVQGTLKSLLQQHSSKASLLWCSTFFIVQLSHPYMTTGKIIALTRWTFVGKVMSQLFNMLSRLVIAFLPRTKHLNFMAAYRPLLSPFCILCHNGRNRV